MDVSAYLADATCKRCCRRNGDALGISFSLLCIVTVWGKYKHTSACDKLPPVMIHARWHWRCVLACNVTCSALSLSISCCSRGTRTVETLSGCSLCSSLCNCIKATSAFCCQLSAGYAVISTEFLRTSGLLCCWSGDVELPTETVA